MKRDWKNPFTPKDFEDMPWPRSKKEYADRANAIIVGMLAEAPEVFGMVTPQGRESFRWFRKPWAGHYGRTTHRARLVDIREIGQ